MERDTCRAAYFLVREFDKYAVSLAQLENLLSKSLGSSLFDLKYSDIAHQFRLNPIKKGKDIKDLQVYQSSLTSKVYKPIMRAYNNAEYLNGLLWQNDTEKAGDRSIRSVYTELYRIFQSRLRDSSEGLLETSPIGGGIAEHLIVSFGSVSSFLLGIKTTAELGEDTKSLTQHVQFMAEAAVVNYQNFLQEKWVPILGLLSDGSSSLMRFYVYELATEVGKPALLVSRDIEGLAQTQGVSMAVQVESILRVAEYIFDFFILSFINGLRAFLHTSRGRAVVSGIPVRHDNTEQREKTILLAERAHVLLPSADLTSDDKMAEKGLSMLLEAVELSPEIPKRLKRKCVEEFADTYGRKRKVIGEDE